MEYHIQQVPMHCRVCGLRLRKTREKPNTSYQCKVFSAELKIAFSIDTSGDDAHIQPERFCICCKHSMQRIISAITKGLHYKCAVIPFQWLKHEEQECKVCEHFKMCAHGHVRRSTAATCNGRQAGITPNLLITHLWKIAPPPIVLHEPCPPLATKNNMSILKELKCVLCSNIVSQPLELTCSALVCTKCIVDMIAASGSVNCPFCSDDDPLVPSHIRPASNAKLLLLSDVLVHCTGCDRDVKAVEYDVHECVPSLTSGEERQAAELLKRAISCSPDKGAIQLATGLGGQPMTFIQLTKARQETSAACSRTVKTRCSEMQSIRSIISGGDSSALIQREVLTLTDEERRSLLDEAGISSMKEIGAAEVLAIKAGLALPWNKLRLLRRWLKSSGICLAGEERMRHISTQIVGDNLKGETAPFSFLLPSGGEEIKGAPLIYIPHLVDKVAQLLDGNERAGRLTWHEGFIPPGEVWLKIGGDKGGGTFKMNFQIVNVATPNSVHNTCVFSCFAAGDSITNLHVALDRFKDQVEHLHGMKWRQYTIKVFMCGDYEFLSKIYGISGASGCFPCPYCIIRSEDMAIPLSARGHAAQRTLETMHADHQRFISAGGIKKDARKFFNCISPPIFDIPVMQVCPPGLHITLGIFTKLFHLLEDLCSQLDLELASLTIDFDASNFSKYSEALQSLPSLQAEFEEAQQSQQELQQMATYMALVNSDRNPLAKALLKQAADKMKYVKALEAKVVKCQATVKKGFCEKEGPFVKTLDSALQSFGVQRQQYFGGAFIGNHVHEALKLPNLKTLCTSISQMAQQKLPHRSEEVVGKVSQFITAFSLFGNCHNICDRNFIDEAHAQALDKAVREFFNFYRNTFPDSTVTIKMHLLEDHAVQWANANHVGFGLLGEQGAESIHAKFNRLALAYAPIRDRVKNLQCIVKEHLLSIEPQLLAAIPPPAKRIKNNESCSSAQPQ